MCASYACGLCFLVYTDTQNNFEERDSESESESESETESESARAREIERGKRKRVEKSAFKATLSIKHVFQYHHPKMD